MDFAEIERRTSPDIARKLQKFDECIAGRERNIDGEQLDELTRGAVVLGAEPVNYPLTDGLYLYLKRPAGDVIALLIETDADEQNGGLRDVLRISKAMIE